MKIGSLITTPARHRASLSVFGGSFRNLPPSYTLEGVLLGMDTARRQRDIDRETVYVYTMPWLRIKFMPHKVTGKDEWFVYPLKGLGVCMPKHLSKYKT